MQQAATKDTDGLDRAGSLTRVMRFGDRSTAGKGTLPAGKKTYRVDRVDGIESRKREIRPHKKRKFSRQKENAPREGPCGYHAAETKKKTHTPPPTGRKGTENFCTKLEPALAQHTVKAAAAGDATWKTEWETKGVRCR